MRFARKSQIFSPPIDKNKNYEKDLAKALKSGLTGLGLGKAKPLFDLQKRTRQRRD